MSYDTLYDKKGKFIFDESRDKGWFVFAERDKLQIAEIYRNERGVWFSTERIPDQTLESYNRRQTQNRRIQIYKFSSGFIDNLILKLGELKELLANEPEPEPEPQQEPEISAQEVIDKAEDNQQQQAREDYMATSSEFQDTSEDKEWED